MVSKCANPACSNRFLFLHEGKLFRLDRAANHLTPDPDFHEHGPQVEFFWLCDHCAADMTVVLRKDEVVVVQPFRPIQRVAS